MCIRGKSVQMEKNNITDNSSLHCTGCGVCVISCPVNALNIALNSEGFYIPFLDETKCTNCGLCKKVCYKFLDFDKDQELQVSFKNSDIYASYSKDEEIRKSTSSGGIGYEIARQFINEGYKICGVSYNTAKNIAEHIIIDKSNIENLDRIKGSKYLQSSTIPAFGQLDKTSKYVVFGTPCQIYGLRQYVKLKNIEENFLLVDFFCHGTPTYLLWSKYLKYLEKKFGISDIEKINFRDKKLGWHNFSMNIDSENSNYERSLEQDIFLDTFLSNVCLNKPCYECALRLDKVYSDIRLGDFWGTKFKDDRKGISIVTANTEKGKQAIEGLEDKVILDKVKLKDLMDSQPNRFLKKPKVYDKTMELLKSDMEVDKIYKKVLFIWILKKKVKGLVKKILKM